MEHMLYQQLKDDKYISLDTLHDPDNVSKDKSLLIRNNNNRNMQNKRG